MIANADHRFMIAEQLCALGIADWTIILEPVGRNTAAAAATAALVASSADPDAIVLLLPVDHLVRDVGAFRRAVESGMAGATNGKLVLFGIPPKGLATGYGYIRVGDELPGASAVREVAGFVEKPDQMTAQRFCTSGGYRWNSGIFLLPARVLLGELERLAPEVLDAARCALAAAVRDLDFLRLADEPFERCPAVSIDYAVMERTDK